MLRPMEEEELQQLVEEQPQLVLASKLVEEKKLWQPLNNGEEFLQELFEEGLVPNIIPQRPK
jgi:hypothetical protein